MYHFEYVSKSDTKPIKSEIIDLIHLAQDEVRDKFTFQFEFIGSESRNIVTYDPKSNVGFDFDVNLRVNDEDENYTAKEIKHILMNAFNKYAGRYHYGYCEDSTRVFTIKVKDKKNAKIRYSCDFAIVNDYGDNRQEYIRFNKTQRNYHWTEQPAGYYKLPDKIEYCKNNNLIGEVRVLYLIKKNENTNPDKKSRTIYAETVHQICQQNGFYK